MKNTKRSFVERVVGFLKLDDNGKIEKFQKQAVKTWENQIAIRRDEIAKLEERKAELLEEKADEIVLNVNIDRLKTIEDREDYLKEYSTSLLALKGRVASFDEFIGLKLKEIDNFTWLIEQVN